MSFTALLTAGQWGPLLWTKRLRPLKIHMWKTEETKTAGDS